MTKPWYMYPVSVPFGDPGFDSGLGGAHDMDVTPPPNYPVTALLPGKVSSISTPPWGKQVGIQLDTPVNGVPYMGYLHLSATNPALSLGTHVHIGDLIGWVGGANDESQYAGTSNPTGENFLNPPFHSSQVQVGVALMRGPEYGTAGWENFPPVDWALDPTPILEAAKRGDMGKTIDLTDPVVAGYFGTTPDGQWQCKRTGFIVRKGILSFYCSHGKDAFCGLTYLGLPLSNEISITGLPGVVKQEFERGWLVYDPNKKFDNPPGASEVYFMHLPK